MVGVVGAVGRFLGPAHVAESVAAINLDTVEEFEKRHQNIRMFTES